MVPRTHRPTYSTPRGSTCLANVWWDETARCTRDRHSYLVLTLPSHAHLPTVYHYAMNTASGVAGATAHRQAQLTYFVDLCSGHEAALDAVPGLIGWDAWSGGGSSHSRCLALCGGIVMIVSPWRRHGDEVNRDWRPRP